MLAALLLMLELSSGPKSDQTHEMVVLAVNILLRFLWLIKQLGEQKNNFVIEA